MENTFLSLKKLLCSLCLIATVYNSYAQETNGIDLTNMDPSIQPQEDFFKYVNGKWLEKTKIPDSEGRWGSFNEVDNFNKEVLKTILEEALVKKDLPKGSNWQLVADLYASGMDIEKINQLGITPIQDDLNAIEKIKDKNQLFRLIAKSQIYGIRAGFNFFVMGDMKNSQVNAAYLWQGGLSLPNRSYYLEDNESFIKIRKEYVQHVARMLELSGVKAKQAKNAAQNIFQLEKRLAKASRTPEENRNTPKLYNKKNLSELKELAPNIPWDIYFTESGVKELKSIIVGQPEFFVEMSNALTEIPQDQWKAYLRWHLLHSNATFLSKELDKENFRFYGQTLRSIQVQRPRWKRIQGLVNSFVGEPLGALYVEKAFPASSKEKMEEMILNLKDAFAVRIIGLDWMSPETKVQALRKLDNIVYKIGYPDKWEDYAGLDIRREDYFGNIQRARLFKHQESIQKIGKAVDPSEWGMTPPTVNAYYSPIQNEIVFPAGILQAPFFNPNADDAVNYGAIGVVIGHELTHGFDDNGSRFDAHGNLENWWEEEDLSKFKKKTENIANQYGAYTVLEGEALNGKLTLGENVADLGGLTIAFEAMKRSWKKNGKPSDIDGFTPEQRFFIGFAQVWRSKYRDAVLLEQIKTDPHSPGVWRTNGTLSNFAPFFEAFNIPKGSPMRRDAEKITTIW